MSIWDGVNLNLPRPRLTKPEVFDILSLIKGSNQRSYIEQSVYDVVNTMSSHPYRNEMMRLLLHKKYAIEVSFFG